MGRSDPGLSDFREFEVKIFFKSALFLPNIS